MAKTDQRYRLEKDSLGRMPVPARAYYGIQTVRAAKNFPISGIRADGNFIIATAMVKKAACEANLALGLIDKKRGAAILKAADEIIGGGLHGEFIVDVYQAGAGTSHNMNANEVIANRAIELSGGKKGDYGLIHPNDHVNMSQSTNDTMPTALRLAALRSAAELSDGLKDLCRAFRKKSREFKGVIKSGRTHLQDAVPITLGQEFGSYASAVESSVENIAAASERLKRIGLGATAAGTGINTHPLYRGKALESLKRISGVKGLVKAPDYFEALNSMQDFAFLSGALKCLSLEFVRIANDIRLLSSGPRTGLSEITLPAVQPGSSIMPGKVNPVMAEMLDMVSYQVVGNDLAVALCAQAGQLELNVMLPLINHNLLHSLKILDSAVRAFTEKCATGIRADKKRCAGYFESSAGLATVLNRLIGYEQAADVAKESASTGKTVKDVVLERGMLTKDEWNKLIAPGTITKPSSPEKTGRR